MFKLVTGVILIAALFFYYTRGAHDPAETEKNVAVGSAFLKQNQDNAGVKVTESGLQYKVLKAGIGSSHPKSNSKVTVHYHGTLINGEVFDSSLDRGEPATFRLNQVIPGWTEGVQLMVVGEKTRFFIPSNLAYGSRAAGKIAPGSTLIFDIELIAIDQ
ncbi:FKBP-type peptidyl-prolyl cis-trans isomerase [Motilimonas pumila]|uniref:Peptidyl-prolyl cis-trans isomerase n=1 Tax=Motilimonas pumila TaxID=2303987 RepID=A0A418YEY0_9GAMM|nr:FKBP-type peptidyl-prolyl cis-trans isomerase [Motilimonas pumila]RJG47757.1 FKBP-type peptidyl-prolyl cis-trans isomerase [Motilimonas pumila]